MVVFGHVCLFSLHACHDILAVHANRYQSGTIPTVQRNVLKRHVAMKGGDDVLSVMPNSDFPSWLTRFASVWAFNCACSKKLVKLEL